MQIQTGIITISDRASKGLYDDLGGPALRQAAGVSFNLDGEPKPIGGCNVPAGAQTCQTDPLAALGWGRTAEW